MYVEQRPDGFLADREAISVWLRRPQSTIRKRCTVVGYTEHGRALYSMEHCELALADAIPRPSRVAQNQAC